MRHPFRMSFPALLTAVGLGVGLSACATSQENPIYQYSSTYGASDTAPVQAAAFRDTRPSLPPALPPTTHPHAIADTHVEPLFPSEPLSPTDEAFGGDTTPGFQALQGEFDQGLQRIPGTAPDEALGAWPPQPSREVAAPPPPAPLPQLSQPMPSQPSRSPDLALPQREADPHSVLTIKGPIYPAGALEGTQSLALMHRVQPGDTVYSLARSYCAEVSTIQAMNGLGADSAIRVGDDLKLPYLCD